MSMLVCSSLASLGRADSIDTERPSSVACWVDMDVAAAAGCVGNWAAAAASNSVDWMETIAALGDCCALRKDGTKRLSYVELIF